MRISERILIVIATIVIIIALVALVTPLRADPIDDTLHKARVPLGTVASWSALAVSIQTDVMGKDNIRAPIDIRRVTGVISPIQRTHDNIKNTLRQVGIVF